MGNLLPSDSVRKGRRERNSSPVIVSSLNPKVIFSFKNCQPHKNSQPEKSCPVSVDGKGKKEGRGWVACVGVMKAGKRWWWCLFEERVSNRHHLSLWVLRLGGKEEQYLKPEGSKGCTASKGCTVSCSRRAQGWMTIGAGRQEGKKQLLEQWFSEWWSPLEQEQTGSKENSTVEKCVFHSCARNKWSVMDVSNLLAGLSLRAPGVPAGIFNHRSGSTAFLTCLTGSYEVGDSKISINTLWCGLLQIKKKKGLRS